MPDRKRRMNDLDCKTCERQIEDFFDDNLDSDDLTEFLYHVEHCDNCREELTIRLLIKMGLKRLEDGGTFHLGHEVDRVMRGAHQRLARRKRLEQIAFFSLSVVLLAIVVVVVIAIFTL